MFCDSWLITSLLVLQQTAVVHIKNRYRNYNFNISKYFLAVSAGLQVGTFEGPSCTFLWGPPGYHTHSHFHFAPQIKLASHLTTRHHTTHFLPRHGQDLDVEERFGEIWACVCFGLLAWFVDIIWWLLRSLKTLRKQFIGWTWQSYERQLCVSVVSHSQLGGKLVQLDYFWFQAEAMNCFFEWEGMLPDGRWFAVSDVIQSSNSLNTDY